MYNVRKEENNLVQHIERKLNNFVDFVVYLHAFPDKIKACFFFSATTTSLVKTAHQMSLFNLLSEHMEKEKKIDVKLFFCLCFSKEF